MLTRYRYKPRHRHGAMAATHTALTACLARSTGNPYPHTLSGALYRRRPDRHRVF